MTRQSVSKHLAALEAANLVTTVWRGRGKLHYLNAASISDIAEWWIDRYGARPPRSQELQEREERMDMTEHATGTREEWLAARLELLAAEKELTRRGDELARQRQALPWVPIDKEYRFETAEGSASLADLFRGRSQLLVYHFMFGPDYSGGCPACSAIADGFNGFAIHLASHDVMLWAVSRAPLEKLQGYKQRMGWSFPWASSSGSDFNDDFDVSSPRSRSVRAPSGTTSASRPYGRRRRTCAGRSTRGPQRRAPTGRPTRASARA